MAGPEQTPLYTPDDKSAVYDDESSSKSLSGAGIRKREAASSGVSSVDSAKRASPESLDKAESSEGFYKKSSSALAQGVKAGMGGEATGAKVLTKTVTGFFVNHKKGTAVGGGVIGFFIFLIVFSAGFLISHELVTIAETLFKYAFVIEEHFEKKADSTLMQKMVCMRTKNCKSGTDPDNPTDDENSSPSAAQEAEAVSSGEELTVDMDTFPITSLTVIDDLAEAGITETSSKGALTGLENSSGDDITQDIASNTDGAADAVELGLPAWNVGQEESFIPLMAEHAGATFDPITPENEDNPDKAIEDDVLDGATQSQIAADASVEDNQAQPSKNDTTQTDLFNDGQQDTGVLSNEINATNQAIDSGKSSTVAIADGEAAASNLGPTLLASTAASDLCSIKAVVGIAALERVPKILTLLIRHGSLLISLADELKSGDLSSGVVSSVMQLYNGDPTAAPTTASNGTTTPAEASLPFSSSSAWQSASGGSGGVAIDASALPTANAGTAVFNNINHYIKLSVVGPLVCAVENSPFGFIANGIAGGVQLFTSEFGSTVIAAAGVLAVQQTIQHVLIPEILKYFTPVGLDGLEDSVQETNNDSAGLSAASSDYSRSLGANPVTNTTATQISSEATAQQDVAESRLPLVDRTLALSNPDSLASHILDNMPVGIAATINGAISYLISIPATIFHNLSTVFSSRVSALTQVTPAAQAAGITQYAFTDSALDKYDPIANEQYLFTNVSYGGNSVQRIAALGNPNTATLNLSGDEVDSSGNSVTNDLLHCYLDSYADLQEVTTLGTGIDTNCYVAGVYDLGDYDYETNTPVSATEQDAALDNTIVGIYCNALNAAGNPKCLTKVAPQVNDDIGHFRQYILDVHVMKDYMSLTTNQ